MHSTSRLGLNVPDASDNVSLFPGGPASQSAGLLDRAMIWATPTTAAARPSAGSVVDGTFHRATDTGVVSYSNGTVWQSITASSSGSTSGTLGAPIATVADYAGSGDPTDSDGVVRWLVCDGRSLLRASYAGLFAVIGTTYGNVDGTHFNIPDARGRATIGAGQGSGLTNRALASTTGAETHTHDAGSFTIGAHTHSAGSFSIADHSHGAGSYTMPSHAHGAGSLATPDHLHPVNGLSDPGVGASTAPWVYGAPATNTFQLNVQRGAGSGGDHQHGVNIWSGAADRSLAVGGSTAASGTAAITGTSSGSGGLSVTGTSGSAGAGSASGTTGSSSSIQPSIVFNKIIRAV